MTIRSIISIASCLAFLSSACAPPADRSAPNTRPPVAKGGDDSPTPAPSPVQASPDPAPFTPIPPSQIGKPPLSLPQTSWTYPNTSLTMSPVETSYPSVSCALTDNRPTQTLMAAIQKLSDAVKPHQECAGDVDLQKANEEVTRLFDSVKGLNQFWEHPETLAQGNNIAQFQALLDSSIRGIDSIGRNFTGNPLLNSKCAKARMGVGDVFIAFTDLVTSFAPFALIGASMNPSLSVALPYVLGVTGAGSAAKIINKMLREQGLDASKPEVRQAILKNICEYIKISEKVRFLKLAQSGQLEFVTREINTNGAQQLFNLYQAQPPAVKQLIQTRNQFHGQIDGIKSTLPKDEAELLTFKLQLQGVDEKPMICEMARAMVNAAGDGGRFPGRSIANFRKLVMTQQRPTLSQEALLRAEENLRAQFSVNAGNSDSCSQIGKSYIEAISRIVSGTGDLYNNAVSDFNSELSKQDKGYSAYITKEARAKKEIETTTRITSILGQLNQDNASIDKVEMHSQMLSLKRALFSKPTDLVNRASRVLSPVGVRGVSSPALEYLDFIADQQAQMTAQFSQEMDSLIVDAMDYRPLYDPFERNEDGSVKNDRYGQPVRKPIWKTDDVPGVMKEIRSRKNLDVLSAEKIPMNSATFTRTCQRLENIWLAWAAVMDHFSAQNFFCSQIRAMFDTETDRDLVQRCQGTYDITGKQTAQSGLQIMQTQLSAPDLRTRALMVSDKLRELNCKMPDGLVVMQGF